MLTEVSTVTIENAFLSLGYSPESAKVYFAALSLGESPASQIAKRANLPRSSTYDILNALVKGGIISVVENNKLKLFSPNRPQLILDLLEQKKESINSTFSNFTRNIESLEDLYLANKPGFPKVRFYEGELGLKTVLFDSLNTKDVIFSICQGMENNVKKLEDEPQYLKDYLNELRVRKIRVKDLLEDNLPNREYKNKYESQFYKCLLIPERSETIEHVDKSIYDNKVVYISHDNKIGIIIEDATLAAHEKAIFKDLWNFYSKSLG